ncbi:hypothetical protein [Streptomyces sp. NPDC096324]
MGVGMRWPEGLRRDAAEESERIREPGMKLEVLEPRPALRVK